MTLARPRPVLAALLLSALVAALYWPATGFDFVLYDDPLYVSENPRVLGGLTREGLEGAVALDRRVGLWIPVTFLSFMADASVFGPGPAGFHRTNILLFALGSAFLLLALREATGSLPAAALATALFALHPMRVESVAWVTERKDCLSLLFLALALGAYLRFARTGRRRWMAGTTVLFALGLASKPSLVPLPFLLLLLDWWPLGRWSPPAPGERWRDPLKRAAGLLAEKLPLFGASAAVAALNLAAHWTHSFPAARLTPWPVRIERLLTSPFLNLGRSLWPANLAPAHAPLHPQAHWGAAGLAAAALAILTVLLVRGARRRPWALFGWLWFLAALLPVSGFIPVGTAWLADRFTLLPHLGLALAAAAGAAPAAGSTRLRKRAVAVLCAAILAALAVASRAQLPAWRDSEALFGRALASDPGDPVFLNNMGVYRMRQGRAPEAVGLLERAVEGDPAAPESRRNLGLALAADGRPGPAAAQFREAVRLRPDDGKARLNLGAALLDAGEAAGAPEAAATEAIEGLSPFAPPEGGPWGSPLAAQGKEQLGRALLALGRKEEAALQWEQALALRPGARLVRLRLADLLLGEGRRDEAAAHWQELVDAGERGAGPSAELLFAKARLRALVGRKEEAGFLLQRAARSDLVEEGFPAFLRAHEWVR